MASPSGSPLGSPGSPTSATSWWSQQAEKKAGSDLIRRVNASRQLYGTRGADSGDGTDQERLFSAQLKSYSMAIETSPNQAVGYYKRGYAYYMVGKYEEAVRDFTQACELNQGYADSFAARGNCLFALGDINGAIRDFRQAIQADPSLSDGYYNLGNAEYTLAHWEEAVGMYSRAIAINENHLEAYNNRANAYKKLNMNSKAIDDLTRALMMKHPPPTTENKLAFYFNRGEAYFQEQRHSEACEDFSRVIKLQADHADSWGMRAAAEVGRERFAEAVEDANQALKMEPDNALAFRWRGQAHFDTLEFNKALEDLDNCIANSSEAANPEFHGEASYSRGMMRDMVGHDDAAREDFEVAARLRVDLFEKDAQLREDNIDQEKAKDKARRLAFTIAQNTEKISTLDPDFEAAYVNRGEAHMKNGDYGKALNDFEKQFEAQPAQATRAYCLSGEVHRLRKEYSRALEMYGGALHIDPNNTVALVGQGMVHLEQGNFEEAMADADSALSIADDVERACTLKGCTFFQLGNLASALSEFDEAISQHPSDAWAHFWRRRVHFANGDLQKGYDDYNKTVQLDHEYDGKTSTQVLALVEAKEREAERAAAGGTPATPFP